MKRRRAPKQTRNPKRDFRFEPLEERRMMAADADAAMQPLDVPVVESSLTASAEPVSPELAMLLQSVHIPMANAEPRSFDGTGNNLVNPDWGSAGEQLLRAADADYSDGASSLAGELRPSPREISNALAAQDPSAAGNERGLSAFVYLWGQFLDHDLDLTSTNSANPELANIEVPTNDPQFDPDGSGDRVIMFMRSIFDPSTGDSAANPRQQVSEVTAWIDGSMIYGSDQATADSLRTFEGGHLRTSEGGMPPVDENGFFLAGDVRVNENIELSSMHALFIREHNWWADQISAQNPNLSDEEVFQRARSIVVAEIQAITFNEFLPALLGRGAIPRYEGYDPTVNPGIVNEFSTAAYRLHTLINDDIEFFGNDGRPIRDEVELKEAFFNPALLQETGIDGILKYVASSQSQEVDTQIVDSLRNFLFGEPGDGGLDLASLNIQRGRDHGLADFNSVREAYGLERADSFADITSDVGLQERLASVYDSVDDIDLWVGLLAEDHAPDSSLGETALAIVSDQFARLRDGDRFWYQNVFSGRDLRQIENTTLADVIMRNTVVDNLQRNVFFMNANVSGSVYVDSNGNGAQNRGEQGIAGATVELLNDEGEVVDTTVTDARGRYEFATFHETGDYSVRVIAPNRYQTTTAAIVPLLVSRGGERVADVDFGLRALRNDPPPRPRPGDSRPPRTDRGALADAAVADIVMDQLAADPARRAARRR